MLKTLTLTLTTCGLVVVSAAIPRDVAFGGHSAIDEPGSMLLLAMAMFGLANAVKHKKGTPRSSGKP
jgi:hypothetical protein